MDAAGAGEAGGGDYDSAAKALFKVVCNDWNDYDNSTLPRVVDWADDVRHRAGTWAGVSARPSDGTHSDGDFTAGASTSSIVAASVCWRNPACGGQTPLHVAVHHDVQPGAPVVCYLLSLVACDLDGLGRAHGARGPASTRDDFGSTPLHWACQLEGVPDDAMAVKALLARGASPDAKDASGRSPADAADDAPGAAARQAIAQHRETPFGREHVPHAFPGSEADAVIAAVVDPDRRGRALYDVCYGDSGSYDADSLKLVMKHVDRIRRELGGRAKGDAAVAAAIVWPNPSAGLSTPLHKAAWRDQQPGAPVVCYMLSLLPETTRLDDIVDMDGVSPFHEAALYQDPDNDPSATSIKAFLARGACAGAVEHEPDDFVQSAKELYSHNPRVVEAVERHVTRRWSRRDVPTAFRTATSTTTETVTDT